MRQKFLGFMCSALIYILKTPDIRIDEGTLGMPPEPGAGKWGTIQMLNCVVFLYSWCLCCLIFWVYLNSGAYWKLISICAVGLRVILLVQPVWQHSIRGTDQNCGPQFKATICMSAKFMCCSTPYENQLISLDLYLLNLNNVVTIAIPWI